MTLNEALSQLSSYTKETAIYFAILILIAVVFSYLYKPHQRTNYVSYILSTIIYLVSIPGLFSLTLFFYSLLIIKNNLLDLDIVIYYLPIAAMISVFFIIARKADFKDLPGFDRLWGLMLMLFSVYAFIFILFHMRIHIIFFGSLSSLFALGAGLFVLIKIGVWKMKKRKY